MLRRLGHLATERPRLVLLVAGIGVLLSAAAGIHAPAKLKGAGFVSPDAPSQVAINRLQAAFGGSPNLVFLVRARSGTVDSPQVAATGEALTARLAASRGVRDVASYWTTHLPALRGRSGDEALVVALIPGSDSVVKNRTKALVSEFSTTSGAVTVQAGGFAGANNAIASQINKDLAVAESVAIPLTMILLILAFGSVVAAALPVAIGLVSIMATLAVLWVLASVTDVSVYSLNMTTAMSLGLAIDYSLLMVSRFREELPGAAGVADAVTRSLLTAGRTILFSAGTVAAALAALLVFPVYFLRSFAYAGISVVVVASLGALVVLPALLTVLGTRVNSVRVPGLKARDLSEAESPFWRRFATGVMRRPLASALPVLAILVVVGLPFLHVRFGSPDDRVLPTSSAARQVGDQLRMQFRVDADDRVEVVTSRALTGGEASSYQQALASVPGVLTVSVRQSAGTTWFSAPIRPDSQSGAAQSLVREVRAIPGPDGATTYVGGSAASLVDQKHDLGSKLPLALGLIALTTFLLLWLFTGSVVLPLKALVLNALSLTAVFGCMVWVFQYGHLSGLLGFTPLPTSTTMPLLLFCIAFGLSMDYEVFILSRIKEMHDSGETNVESVVGGLARSGRIVTTAAALLAVTFFAFATSKVSFIQMFGLGTGLAVLADATLIRAVLVPSFMRIAGEANWWSPPVLRRLHDRIGLAERDPDAAAPARAATAAGS